LTFDEGIKVDFNSKSSVYQTVWGANLGSNNEADG